MIILYFSWVYLLYKMMQWFSNMYKCGGKMKDTDLFIRDSIKRQCEEKGWSLQKLSNEMDNIMNPSYLWWLEQNDFKYPYLSSHFKSVNTIVTYNKIFKPCVSSFSLISPIMPLLIDSMRISFSRFCSIKYSSKIIWWFEPLISKYIIKSINRSAIAKVTYFLYHIYWLYKINIVYYDYSKTNSILYLRWALKTL